MKLLLAIIIGFVAVNAAYAAVRGKLINTWEQDGGDVEQLKPRGQSRHPGALFNALKRTSTKKWDNLKDSQGNYVVPYVISATNYNRDELEVIKGAMKAIEENTCIRYKKRSSEKDYINIVSADGGGCYTFVGRTGGPVNVQLQAGDRSTCIAHKIVIHELFHSLGLWHEQMRFDRDNYITVHYDNISPGAETQFTTVDSEKSTTYGEEYDYRSVMHYPKNAFGTRGKITMETKDPQYMNIIGKARTASPADYRKICNIYQCQSCPGGGSSGPSAPAPRPSAPAPRPSAPAPRPSAPAPRPSAPAPRPSAPAPSGSSGCKDTGSDCANWTGFCENKNYSESTKKRLCAKTCNLC